MDFMPLPEVTTLAAPFFVLSVALEWWAVKTGRATGRYETKDAFASMAMGVGNLVVNIVVVDSRRQHLDINTWIERQQADTRRLGLVHADACLTM